MIFKLMQISCLVFSVHLNTRAQDSAPPASDLKALLQTEEEIIKSLRTYVKAEKRRIDFLEKYLARSKLEYEIAIKDVPYYFGNPINAYTTIKRLGPDLNYVEEVLKNKTELQTPEASFPTEEDLMTSALGLSTVLSMYNLNVSQVANGIINATGPNGEVFTEITTPMTASDCHSIGTFLFMKMRYQEAIPWLEEAFRKSDVHCEICPVPTTEVIDNLCTAYHELGEQKKYLEWARKRIALHPDDPKSSEYERHIRALHSHLVKNHMDTKEKQDHSSGLTGLCLATAKSSNKRLSCHYAHGPHPIFTLGPLKVERLHSDPDLDLFYDVLSDEDVDAIKSLVSSKWNATRRDMDVFRNAEFLAVEDAASEAVARARRRAVEISGLGREPWRPLNVVNFGIGRFRRQRLDAKIAKKLNMTRHNISATVLIYLSDVELGGTTVFPLLNLTVSPKKGAALFYSNKLPSGELDLLVVDTSCPVLRGTKWVAVNHYTNTSECSVWKTDRGVVTHKMYKKIVKDRQKRINKHSQLQSAKRMPIKN